MESGTRKKGGRSKLQMEKKERGEKQNEKRGEDGGAYRNDSASD